MSRRKLLSVVAVSLCACTSSAYAATAQVGVNTFASDLPSSVEYTKDSAGSPASGETFATRSVTTTAGNSTAFANAEADARKGTLKATVGASVAASSFVIGRNSGSNASAAMDGAISLVGPATPGPATFTAVLEGTYSVAGQDILDNRALLHYEFTVGNSPQMNGDPEYPCCGAGAFSIPFTWTQTVNPGDSITFTLYLKSQAFAVAGTSGLDISNTFKITGITLPTGYSYNSDAQGFLSEFSLAPVPEPETYALMLAGLGILGAVIRRKRAG
jgi:PEP-CTERM motif